MIVPLVLAERASGFASFGKLGRALEPLGLVREPLNWKAAFRVGRAYQPYRERGGTKRSPDFHIGAHALLGKHALLTRDPRRYRKYFPKLKVIAPY